jgi:glyoxylase-like metal-dependent hydrolase (beta-lactamase superfamily II)
MLEIHKIVVPTPYMVGPVNAYLIKNQPCTLVDPGPETAEAKNSLEEGLSSLGVAVRDIKRVLITHNHSDHSGLARWIAEKAQAAFFVHKLEIRKLTPEYIYYQERIPFFIEGGLPESELKDIFNDVDPVVKPLLPESGVEVVEGGEELHFDGGSLQVLHLPGHTSGHICLYNPVGRELLAGDFLLKHITPNPVMEADHPDNSRRAPSLRQYLDSLNKIEEVDVRINFPGHGETIEDNREVAAKARKHHARRLEKIHNIIEAESMNAYQVMRLLYPKIRGFQIFLGISEVFAHLDYLNETGRITREERKGISIYHKKS